MEPSCRAALPARQGHRSADDAGQLPPGAVLIPFAENIIAKQPAEIRQMIAWMNEWKYLTYWRRMGGMTGGGMTGGTTTGTTCGGLR